MQISVSQSQSKPNFGAKLKIYDYQNRLNKIFKPDELMTIQTSFAEKTEKQKGEIQYIAKYGNAYVPDIIIYMKTANRSQLFIEEEVEYICALYKFEFEVSFPVSDVTEVIVKTGNFPGEYQACSKKIRIYEQFSERMDGVVQENKCLSLENKKLKVYKKGFFAFLTLFVLMLYVSVYLLMIIGDAQIPLIETLFDKIKESWFSLFSIVVIPVVTFIFNRFLKKEEDKE